eukprot:5624903-Amphidinium_carterae.1
MSSPDYGLFKNTAQPDRIQFAIDEALLNSEPQYMTHQQFNMSHITVERYSAQTGLEWEVDAWIVSHFRSRYASRPKGHSAYVTV